MLQKSYMKKGLLRYICGAALAIIAPFSGNGQEIKLPVVDKLQQQKLLAHTDSSNKMIELKQLIPDLQYQLYYATADNFTKQKLYKRGNKTYLRLPAAKALRKVQTELLQKGLGIKIWDAYRPYSATKKMWILIKDERYVANPAKGSGHNRGVAIDMTLYDLKSGTELDMGTSFDNFTDTAHHNFKGLSALQQQNRLLLKTVMESNGFKALDTEWWHYSWSGQSFPVLDLSFSQLARLAD